MPIEGGVQFTNHFNAALWGERGLVNFYFDNKKIYPCEYFLVKL